MQGGTGLGLGSPPDMQDRPATPAVLGCIFWAYYGKQQSQQQLEKAPESPLTRRPPGPGPSPRSPARHPAWARRASLGTRVRAHGLSALGTQFSFYKMGGGRLTRCRWPPRTYVL